jgi:hypothetical protein
MPSDTDVLVTEVLETIDELSEGKERARGGYNRVRNDFGDRLEPFGGKPPAEFLDEPYLLVASDDGDQGDRPLPQRPDSIESLNSVDVEFIGPNGPTVLIEPGVEYNLRATVRNLGDSDIPPSPVEFFVSHIDSRQAIIFDTTDGEIVLDPDPPHRITGRVLGLPGAHILISVRGRETTSTRTSLAFEGSNQIRINADRTFTAEFDLSQYVSDDPLMVTGKLLSMPGLDNGTRISLRFDDDDDNITVVKPLPHAVGVDDVKFIDHQRVRHLAEDETTVSVPYTAPQLPFRVAVNRRLTVFHVRAYSLSPLDLPEDLDVLDHRRSRMVGRREVYWQ